MANIKDKIENIRKAVFGKDVRGSLADGLDAVNKETETTTSKQEHLEKTFDELIINAGTSNAEVVDARVDKNSGTSFKKLGDRLDAHSAQMAESYSKIEENSIEINNLNTTMVSKYEKGVLDLEIFDDATKNILMGQEPGHISPTLGVRSITRRNLNEMSVGINNISDAITNLIDTTKITYNRIVAPADGTANAELKNHYHTDYIEIDEDTIYTVPNNLPSMGAFYDENKIFIRGLQIGHLTKYGANYIFTSVKRARYIRINFSTYQQRPSYCFLAYGKYLGDITSKLNGLKIDKTNMTNKSVSTRDLIQANVLPTNLLNPKKVRLGVYLNSSGEELSTEDTIYTTDYIPVNDNLPYTFNEIVKIPGIWFDCNKKVISWINDSVESTIPLTIMPPKGACFVRWTADGTSPIERTMLIEGSFYPDGYLPYSEAERTDYKGLATNMDNIIHNAITNKKYLVIGDSISISDSVSKLRYHHLLSAKLMLKETNKAVSGSGYLVSTSGNDNFSQVIDRLEDAYDLITIFGGTNDYGRTNLTGNRPFGEVGDKTMDTFCGAVYSTLSKLIVKFPTTKIIVITPLPRLNGNNINANGKTLREYAKAEKDIAQLLSIPVIDLNSTSNCFPENAEFNNIFMPDGLHPNERGHSERLSNKIIHGVIQNW